MKPFQNIDHLMRWYVHHHLTATDVHYPSCTPHPDHIVVDRTPMNDHDVHIADQAYTWRLIDIEVRAWIINHTRRDYETVRKLLCLTWEMARKEPEGAGYKNRNQYDKARSGLYERLSGHLMYQPNLVPLMVDPDERDLQYRRAG